jgi:hypothetical protein
MIDQNGGNDCDWEKDEVEEEFYSNVLLDERSKAHKGIPESAEDEVESALEDEKEVIVNEARVIPERGP